MISWFLIGFLVGVFAMAIFKIEFNFTVHRDKNICVYCKRRIGLDDE